MRPTGGVGRNRKVLDATDPNSGTDYALPIAAGDRIRLFARTNAKFREPAPDLIRGQAPAGGRSGAIGDNGSILEVRSVRHDGLVLRNDKGTEGLVRWESPADSQSGRLRITYGYAIFGIVTLSRLLLTLTVEFRGISYKEFIRTSPFVLISLRLVAFATTFASYFEPFGRAYN